MPRFLILLTICLLAEPVTARPLVVVVDPGHGGSQLGAVGVTGVAEKRLTLKAASLLKQRLGQQPGIQVVLTRSRDRLLSLSERARRAARSRGDLFVSLHANASPRGEQRGFEVFVLGPGEVLRQRHPAAERDDLTVEALLRPGGPARLEVAGALQDLRLRANRRASVALGRSIVASMERALGSNRSRGLRESDFDLLMDLRMPAVLIEMGFIDHVVEGRLLLEEAYLSRIVSAVSAGILRYIDEKGLMNLRAPSQAGEGAGENRRTLPYRRRDRRRPAPGAPRRDKKRPVVALDTTA